MSAVYFASDFHLGVPDAARSLEREKKLVRWLKEVATDAECIYLVGDIFDFWFEYRHAVPKGFTRLLGTLSELSDAGIRIEVFTGNHDMWMFRYLEEECGLRIHRKPQTVQFQGKTIMLGHGDGLGPGDHGYKFIKKVFANPVCQWLFARLHPNFGIGMANFWSRKSRAAAPEKDRFRGEDQEWLLSYCKEVVQQHPEIDYFIFGHRHLPLDFMVNAHSRYVNLGDWFEACTYAVLRDGKLELKSYS
jgi:UDP-2,3-diacylglucosamine hydrolase